MTRKSDEGKVPPKRKDVRAYYDRAKPNPVTTIAAEYAELRTRTPGGRG
jgi:hypothetical protein